MRLCLRAGARRLLLLLVLVSVRAEQQKPRERHYYIAAKEIDWSYTGDDRSGPTYKKVVFREYDRDFKQAKTHPSWLGLLGPTLRGEVGETIVVTFRNMATGALSLHPHGIAYGKQSEGAQYFDNTSLKEKEDDNVQPNCEHVYHWEVTPEVSPQPSDPNCITHTYVSHHNVVEDFNSGLIGTLLICKPGSLDEAGEQIGIHKEFSFLFGVFDEEESKSKPNSFSPDNHVKYTINGYTQGTLPDISLCAHAPVSLHLIGMSSEPEVFSVHINGQVLQHLGHKVASVGLISGSSTTASMVAVHPGRWLLSSYVTKHREADMHGFVNVTKCDAFKEPRRRLTIEQKRQSREWTYFIAAEEKVWDYAPEVREHVDEDFKFKYLRQSPTRIGKKYKKAVYTQYKDESFTEKSESKKRREELGILGPVIRAQIRDIIKIVFKNMASRPYSIYPHGLTIAKSEEGANYPAGGNQSHAVQPGETYTYEWMVTEEDEPLEADSRCQTRLYHSAVDTPRDIASGLIGPMLICKSQSLNVRNVQLKADKEQHAVLAVFDENKSWYLDQNIRLYTDRSKVNKANPDFYKSNVMHTINGYVYESGPLLGFCNGEIATWHVSSVGVQDNIQTATFYGHSFELNERTEDYLSLYPMTGETISMNMENIGVWLMATLNSHETMKGMRIKFQDVECYRDYQYEYNDYNDADDNPEFTAWKPLSLDELKKQDEKAKKEKEEKKKKKEPDLYSDLFAAELGLRSLRNQNGTSGMEWLDLSFLDYDAVDVVEEDPNMVINITERKNTSKVSTPKPNGHNETSQSHFTEVDGPKTDNSLSSILDNSTTALDTSNTLKKNETVTTRSRALVNVSNFQNETERPTKSSNLKVAFDGNSSSVLKNVTLTVDNKTSISTILLEEPEERLNRGDVFSSSDPNINNSSTTNLKVTTSPRVKKAAQNDTETVHADSTANGTNQSAPVPVADVGEIDLMSTDGINLTNAEFGIENPGNKSNDNSSAAEPGDGLSDNSSECVTIASILENVIKILLGKIPSQKVPVDLSKSNSSDDSSLEGLSNGTTLTDRGNQAASSSSSDSLSNETMVSGNFPISGNDSSTLTESSEEVVIYLKGSDKKGIKSTPVKTGEYNWTYEGTHQEVHMEIPDDIKKYLSEETLQTTPPPKKTKKVTLRQRPLKGQGMKTRRRKEYKPQARSGLPFSPRGFNPGLSPRGSRPNTPQRVSDEEELINMPVVIGVPRPDFSDYELYIPGDEPDHIGNDEQDLKADEYEYVIYKDPYSGQEDIRNLNLDETAKYYLKMSGTNVKTYFIAAEEVEWDYAGYGQRRQEKTLLDTRETKFKKVVFRGYMDSSFRTPEIRGEMDEHLGILGPLIQAEVGQSIMVVFKNNAKRPFSLHPNGVTYTKQMEGLSYEDNSKYWFQYDNEVKPNANYTYIWKVPSMVGPLPDESDCRTWAYYSGVNPERDINSGLIGPLLVCREGTLTNKIPNMRQFMLLFMTFDESQSWYYERNRETIQRRSRVRSLAPNFRENLKFHTINGIIYSLKGLRMSTNQLVSWHLINMGSPKDFQSVHFHGQTFLHKQINSYRQAVYPLLPGSFATLEMYPSKPGLWQLETEVGSNQRNGMQTLFLVLDDDCSRPLGLESGSVKDDQFTATNTRGYWEPYLARLNNAGKYNAWSTGQNHSWIQVDFQRPVVISQVATQGAKQLFDYQHVDKYHIAYSLDRRAWTFFKGDSNDFRKVFTGKYETTRNTFFPPVIARFIRLHPIHWTSMATVRMEFYGCELDGCSVPLGMETGLIKDNQISASSIASSWYSGPWTPSLARLNKQGTINAWQAKNSDMNQWIQVALPQVKKITGIVTQGARSLGREMFVMTYTLQYSDNGVYWTYYTDDENVYAKLFKGNSNANDHVKNYIYPPIFSRFIRIHPKSWTSSITLRIELLGCEFE